MEDREMKLPPEIEARDHEAKESAVNAVGSAAPMAEEQLDPGQLGRTTDALNAATGFLSDGDIAPVEIGEVEEGARQVPAPLYAGLVAYQGGIDAAIQAGMDAERYQIDADAASRSNSGLREAEMVLKTAAKARSLKMELAAPAKKKAEKAPKEPKLPPEKGSEPDVEGLY